MGNTVHRTAVVADDVELGDGNEIGPFAIIESGCKLGSGNVVMARAQLATGTSLGDENRIYPGAVVGHEPQDVSWEPWPSFTRIGSRNRIREYVTIHRGTQEGSETVIGDECFLMAYSHVAHNVVVGDRVTLVNNASLTGHCEVGDGAILSGMVGLHQFTRVGRLAIVSALSAANRDIPPFVMCGGRPVVAQGVNLVGLRRNGFSPDARAAVKRAFKVLFRSGLSVPEAIEALERDFDSPEVAELAAFVRDSKRGVIAYGEDRIAHRKRSGIGATAAIEGIAPESDVAESDEG